MRSGTSDLSNLHITFRGGQKIHPPRWVASLWGRSRNPSTGFNGFPRGIADDSERLEDREQKYPLICHAEENAIMHAARIGLSLKGCTAYVTWPPCTRCARSLIQAGVVEVVYPTKIEVPERWQKDFDMSTSMMKEAGIKIRQA
ncbi:MAG: hypothetical protein Ct9H90mP16_10420 [Candidatus Poseidoniales archaeon]|nr:MAG: hypothetical protein Ct9H90mP16_10420 [Candidatus Poseidoniales archaeon]